MDSFMEWAEKQFGKRPDAEHPEIVASMEVRARNARDALERRRDWDRLTNAALYAWNAAPTLRQPEPSTGADHA